TSAAIAFVVDGSVPLQEGDFAVANLLAGRPSGEQTSVILVWNKHDLGQAADREALSRLLPDATQVTISATTGEGLSDLEAALATALRGGVSSEARPALISARQRAAVERALQHI